MRQFRIRLDDNGADAVRCRSILATLPNSFVVAEGDGSCDVVFLSRGSGGLAADLSALPDDVKAVVISGWGALDAEEFALLVSLNARGVLVIPAYDLLPRVWELGEDIENQPTIIDMVCRYPGEDRAARVEALTEQLAFAELAAGQPVRVQQMRQVGDGMVLVTGRIDPGVIVRMALIPSPIGNSQWNVDLVSRGFRVAVDVDLAAIAKPALVRKFDRGGEHRDVAVYQNSGRLIWTALHAHLSGQDSSNLLNFERFRRLQEKACSLCPK